MLATLLLAGCTESGPQTAPTQQPDTLRALQPAEELDRVARNYVKLSLEIGAREPGYIDAYYGPAQWKQTAESSPRTLADLGNAVVLLEDELDAVDTDSLPEDEKRRAIFLRGQLIAARTRLVMAQGETLTFRKESLGLFGTTPDLQPLESYDPVLARIDTLVPGKGSLDVRVSAFLDRYIIPPERLRAVFDAAIGECRKRTAAHINLPENETFTLEFVTGKAWSGYNYYQGNYKSLIQVNTDLPIRISRAIDLGCHEGYPGHHALNVLLEQRLTRSQGWEEFSVYPLYSPQSLIAEGSANYGIDLAFPGEQRLIFERDVLYPLAGLDPATARMYFDLTTAINDLAGARFTIAEQYLDGKIDRKEAVRLIRKYQLVDEKRAQQSVDFNDTYRSYVINYGLGQELVRDYVASVGNDPRARWKAMERVISEPTVPAYLMAR